MQKVYANLDGDLGKLIQNRINTKKYFTIGEIKAILGSVAIGLDEMHRNKIIHRDLKPQNIFVCDDTFKIGDLGLAGIIKTDEMFRSQKGTPAYMAPEIINQVKYSYPVDIWSLGCIAYELYELAIPFNSPVLFQLLSDITNSKYPPLSNRYSADLRSLIQCMLLKDPSKRPTSKQVIEMISNI